MRYLILSVLALFLLAPFPAHAMNEDISKAESFLKGMRTAKADFIQRNNHGGILTGQFYLHRPGRLRFEYNEIDDFIVADGLLVYFYDSELGSQSNAPIGQTMADFLLREDLTLRDDLTVTDVRKGGGNTYLTIVQSDDPAAGYLDLTFSNVPYELRKWKVTDATGAVTEIELKNIEYDVELDSELFAYYKPKDPSKRFND